MTNELKKLTVDLLDIHSRLSNAADLIYTLAVALEVDEMSSGAFTSSAIGLFEYISSLLDELGDLGDTAKKLVSEK